jgi:hypothetical protein
MNEYDFTLKFDLENLNQEPEIYVDQLYEAGCDDALIGLGKRGEISLNFIRESASAKEAMLMAIADVKQAIPDARFVKATPDLVNLTDVATLLGCSRQNVRKLIVENRPVSPAPVYQGQVAIWHLADILSWLQWEKGYEVDGALLAVAEAARGLNVLREWQRLSLDWQGEEAKSWLISA